MEPLFGERTPGLAYAPRPGAYALILDPAERMLIIRLRPERHFLPGGGIEPGETPEQCLIREIAEETGHAATIGPALGTAMQYSLSARWGPVAIHARYYRAELGAPLHDEPEHETLWLNPREAVSLLAREADRWLVGSLFP